jgi:hypothetical protein
LTAAGVLVATVAGLAVSRPWEDDGGARRTGGSPGTSTPTRPVDPGGAPDVDRSPEASGAWEGAQAYRFDGVRNVCDSVDLRPLKVLFEQQDRRPDANRSPGVGPGTGRAHCIASLGHVDGTGLADSIVTLSFTLIVEEDPARAREAYERDRDNAAKNGERPAQLRGVGEQAYTCRADRNPSGAGKDVTVTMAVRDGNLLWDAQIEAGRIAEDNWSAARRKKIEAAFLEAAKRSFTRASATARVA